MKKEFRRSFLIWCTNNFREGGGRVKTEEWDEEGREKREEWEEEGREAEEEWEEEGREKSEEW